MNYILSFQVPVKQCVKQVPKKWQFWKRCKVEEIVTWERKMYQIEVDGAKISEEEVTKFFSSPLLLQFLVSHFGTVGYMQLESTSTPTNFISEFEKKATVFSGHRNPPPPPPPKGNRSVFSTLRMYKNRKNKK